MAEGMTWGSFGDVPFEFLTSPVYGSVRRVKRARFNQKSRIISRGFDGSLKGQKPLKEIAGIELATVTFNCRVSTLVLKALSLNVLEALALAAGVGPLAGSLLGDAEDDKRFYTDVIAFLDVLDETLETQEQQPFTIGTRVMGLYTLDELDITEKHKKDGSIFIADIKIALSEWVE